MNLARIEPIANAVLYEGYLLYPYRPSSVKNRQRWTFGGVYPHAYSEAQGGADAWTMQTECLVSHAAGGTATNLEVKVRFLHLLAREVGELIEPLADLPAGQEPPFRPVEALTVGERVYRTWQEATERAVGELPLALDRLVSAPYHGTFAYPARRELEPLRSPAGEVVGVLVRNQAVIAGVLAVAAEEVGEGLFKVMVQIQNVTPFAGANRRSRDEALLHSFVSTHTILGVRGGEFVSLLDPPQECREAAAACTNVGAWPVLVGAEGTRDTMLSSPIILYDYPEVAPESPGDLFDGTEIDEILTLRILAMTDAEKQEAREIDEHARALLDRTETLSAQDLWKLHGAVRGLRPFGG